MTAIKLGGAEKWGQAFADATTRRQLAFQAFIIGLMVPGGDDDDGSISIDPVVVSSCIFMEDERSETQVESILEKVSYTLLYSITSYDALTHSHLFSFIL